MSAAQFGNAPVLASVLRSLSEVPSMDEPAGRVVTLAPSPFAEVRVPECGASFLALSGHAPAIRPTYDVAIPDSDDRLIRFDLWGVFRSAASGHNIPLTTTEGYYVQAVPPA